jgi:NADH-quinone oxidoreductase subunit H
MIIELWHQYLLPILIIVLKIIAIIIPLLLSVAYLTLAERKIIAAMQLRKGPNVTGPFGLLQPLADGLKLMCKEIIIPSKSNKIIFLIAPVITFSLALIGWAVIPVSEGMVLANINVGVLYLLAISSLGVYGIIMGGWASNSKYAFLGAIRSSAQMISYEVSMGLVIITVIIATGSLNLSEIVIKSQSLPWYIDVLLLPMLVVFFISILAETNRLPFDLPEAEAELVAGYNVEYSSMPFFLFYFASYGLELLFQDLDTIN